MGSNATHLLKNATMFAKGCCIHGGMVFFMQSHFTSCLFKMHIFLMLLIFQTMPHFLQRVATLGIVFFLQNHFTSAV